MLEEKILTTEVVEEDKPKRKRGRPKNSGAKRKSTSSANKPDFSEQTGLETAKLFSMLYGKGGTVSNRNPLWLMEDSEIAALSTATDAVLAKYTLSDNFAYKEELSLALVLFTTVIPRAVIQLKITKLKKQNSNVKAKQNYPDNRTEGIRENLPDEKTQPEN